MAGKAVNYIKQHPVLMVLLLGAIVRIIFLLTYSGTLEWQNLTIDSMYHHRWAQSIASGNLIGTEAYFHAPLYIYILGLLYAVFGVSLTVARIFGILIGLVSVYLTYAIGKRLFSEKAGIIAGVIHALYPIGIYFESELLVDALFTMLMQLSVFLIIIAVDKLRLRFFALTGIAIGLAAMTRPVILALVPLFLIYALVKTKPRHAAITAAVTILLVMVVVIMPVTLRNLLVADDLVLISSSGGINFYIGNNASSSGLSATMPPPLGAGWEIRDVHHMAENETGRRMTSSEVSDYWYEKGWQWIKENKVEFFKLYIKKLYFFINNAEVPNNRDLGAFIESNVVLKMMPLRFGFLLALAAAGIFLRLRGREISAAELFCLGLIVLYMLVLSMFFVNARFRLPVLPYFFILASAGLIGIVAKLRERKNMGTVVPAIVIGLAAGAFSFTNLYHIAGESRLVNLFNKGNYYLSINNTAEARRYYSMVLEEEPAFLAANMNKGVTYLREKNYDSARYYFRRELMYDPYNAMAYSNLAAAAYGTGNYDTALMYCDSALAIKPYLLDAYLIKLRLAALSEDRAMLARTVDQALENLKEPSLIYLDAGLLYSKLGVHDKAREYLEGVLEMSFWPVETDGSALRHTAGKQTQNMDEIKAKAAGELSFIEYKSGNSRGAIEYAERAIEFDPAMAEGYICLINGYLLAGDRSRAKDILQLARERHLQHPYLSKLAERLR